MDIQIRAFISTTFLSACLFYFLISCRPLYAQEDSVKIIVNKNNPIEQINTSEVSRIFLKRLKTWDSGELILPVDLISSSNIRLNFCDIYLQRSVHAVKNYWQQMIFSGRDIPPPELTTESEVLEYVRNNKNAIGYISTETPAPNVKEIKAIKE